MGRLTAVGAGQPQRHLGTAEAEPDAGFDVCEVAYTSADDTGERLHRPGVGDPQVHLHHEGVDHGEGVPGR
jgi:hypothetical protein